MDIARAPVLVAAAGLLVASVAGLATREDRSRASSIGPRAVLIAEFAFEPDPLSVEVGDSITFTNQDAAAHTVTSDGAGPLDSGDLDQDEVYELVFDQAGSYRYLCQLHPFMTGTVEVHGA